MIQNTALRISQTALTKAGGFKLEQNLHKADGENLAGLLKYMVENSAIAQGKNRHGRRGNTRAVMGAKRRRYGDFILILKGPVLVDIVVERHDWCRTCLGADRATCTRCN